MNAYHEQIHAVQERIAPYVRETPLIESDYLSKALGAEVLLKCEVLQHTGSFKMRGAANKITQLTDRSQMLVTASGGNHAPAVCMVGTQLGHAVKVFLPKSTPVYKINRAIDYGGSVVTRGKIWDEADEYAQIYAKEHGAVYIHPFSDDAVIDGQATVAAEMLQQNPNIDILIGSIGGGGLLSGVSKYAKSINPNIKVYGVETFGADSMYQSIAAGHVVPLSAITSIAEGLGAKMVTQKTFDIVRECVDGFYRVTDQEALAAQTEILQNDKLLTEPSASCSVAALSQIPNLAGKTVGIILCGGNYPVEKLGADQ